MLNASYLCTSWFLLLAGSLLLACNNSSSVSSETSFTESEESSPTPTASATSVVEKTPLPLTSPRIFTCAFSESNSHIRITNHTAKASRSLTIWFFFYNAEGKKITQEAKRTEGAIPAGESLDAPFSAGTQEDRIGCEVSAVDFDDGSSWSNVDLAIYSPPYGGMSDEALAKKIDRIVEVEWIGQKTRPTIRLTNLSTRPVRVEDLYLVFFSDDGLQISREILLHSGAELKPAETRERGLSIQSTQKSMVEIRVLKLTYLDGEQEVWTNRD